MEKRIYIPGSEWVYFKVYTGAKTADSILKNEMYGYVCEMMNNKIIDKWFFVRYYDPDFHIRLRLHLNEKQNFKNIFIRFFEIFNPMIDNGLVWNIQCDTYKREMERYGENTIDLIENLFFMDSEFILSLLHQLNKENPEQHRWKLALVLIDSILLAFSFDLSKKKELLKTMAEGYKKEFGFTHHQAKKQLDEKYRANRKEIENAMLWENEFSTTANIIKTRMQSIRPVAEKIKEMNQSEEIQVPLNNLLTSLIHMNMNRWFRSKNKLYELVVYDFLSRYYTSETVKNKGI